MWQGRVARRLQWRSWAARGCPRGNSCCPPCKVPKLSQCSGFPVPLFPQPLALSAGYQTGAASGKTGQGEPGGNPYHLHALPGIWRSSTRWGWGSPPHDGTPALAAPLPQGPCTLVLRAGRPLSHPQRVADSVHAEPSSGSSCRGCRNQEGRRRWSFPSRRRISPPSPPVTSSAQRRADAQLCPPAPRRTQGPAAAVAVAVAVEQGHVSTRHGSSGLGRLALARGGDFSRPGPAQA